MDPTQSEPLDDSLLQHIIAYSKLGWALTPVHGKMAVVPGWQKTQPLPPHETEDMWRRRLDVTPEMNIGLVLGPSGVLDYEMDSGTEEEFLAPFGGDIPDTPAYRTGSGKLHLLFDAGDGRQWTRLQNNGFELRAGAHQSVLPPSTHINGVRYEWVDGHEPWNKELALPPVSLFDRMQVTDTTPGTHWLEVLASKEKLGEGQGRHASLISYLGRMVETLDTEEQLISAGLTFAAETQNPPYPDDVVRQQARDVWRRYKTQHEVPEGYTTITQAADSLNIRRLDQIQMRSIKFLWKPFLQRSAFHLLAGQKGAGKGTILAWVAANITNGEWDEPRGVMWCRTEDSFEIDVKPRFMAQKGDPTLFYAVHKHIQLPSDLPAIETFARQADVGLIVIDPIGAALPSKSSANDETDVLAAIGGLNDLADELDIVVIGVRHLGKAIERGALHAILGNVAWVNTPRAVLGLAQDEAGLSVLEVLAGNRVRGHAAHEFNIAGVELEGLDEEVTVAEDMGASKRSVDDVVRDKGSAKMKYVKQQIMWMLDQAIGNVITPATQFPLEEWEVTEAFSRRACRELKEEGKVRWIMPPRDSSTGEFMPGFHWELGKAYESPH